jgi:hypothetical protein
MQKAEGQEEVAVIEDCWQWISFYLAMSLPSVLASI